MNVCPQAHLSRDLHNPAITDQFGDFDGRYVERIGQRVAHRDTPHESFSIIIWRIFLAVEFKRRRLVIDCRGRSDDGLNAVNGVVKRRGIDKRFEHRTRLAVR